jgi:hypothetical protein
LGGGGGEVEGLGDGGEGVEVQEVVVFLHEEKKSFFVAY